MRQTTRRHQPTRPCSLRRCLSWLLALTLTAQTAALPTARAAHPRTTAPAASPNATPPTTPPAPQSNVDLTVTALNAASVVTDSQTLLISGELVATIKNLGSAATAAQFRVLAFEDRNANGQFNAGTDALLGALNVTDSIAAGASANLSLALSGTVTFEGNLIYVWVDSENAIAETNENNNIRNTGGFGNFILPPGQLNAVLKWKKDTFAILPSHDQVMMTPAVIDVNNDQIPDIVFSSFVGNNDLTNGVLRAISGSNGVELWTVTDSAYRVKGLADIAVGDIDNDGKPEIIAKHESGEPIAFEHDGTFKWRSAVNVGGNSGNSGGGASIADLDHDGSPEIIFGATVLHSNGTLRWKGNEGLGAHRIGTLSCVADLDLDSNPEVVAGRTAYRVDGTVYWNASISDGTPAIGNFDNDAFPEVVVVTNGSVYLLEHNGQAKWGPVALPGGGYGGAPTVADIDSDGQPEIGVAGASRYVVIETNGSIKWEAPTQDGSSNVTGSSVFDFEGDGRAEVIYGDELFLRIYSGIDGAELYRLPKGSGTSSELPVIADIDADGHAEIVAAANNYAFGSQTGIYVIGGADNNWVNTRRIWNQHTYHVTNINEDGTIPRNEQPNWLTPGLNNFRLNTFAPGEGNPTGAPDLTASLIRKNDTAFPTSTELTARIGNGGGAFVPPGVRVSFYRGDPAAGGTLIGTTQTATSLQPGQFEDVKVVWNNPPAGLHPITVVADDTGTGQGTVTEGNETNNKAMANIALGIGPFTLVDDLIARFKDASVDLKWSPIAGAVGYNIYRRTGDAAPQLIRQNHPRANFADAGLTNGTTYYYTVRWVNTQGTESGDGTEMSATPTAQSDRNNVPPTILSAPVTRAVANQPYAYDARALDPNAADQLRYQLPTPATDALRAVTINAATGLLEWTPAITSAGYQNVTVRVEDSRGRFATQTYRLFVEIPNSPPLANAGADQTIMATETAHLLGTALDDGLPFGGTLTTSWRKLSGPGQVVFANPSQPVTTATFSAEGSYVLRLTASDSQAASSDDVTINVVRPFASRLYTLNADFDQGNLNNVEHRIPHQLQLAEQAQPFNFIWVAVSSKGTIVKINTDTGQILGEYRTAPEGQATNPSRTTVDLNGNVWVANRNGNSVTRVGLIENGGCIDRNGNGRIDTSTAQNDIKPWTNAGSADTNGGVSTAQDECIINYVRVSASGTRHLSVDRNNNVWVSGWGAANQGVFDLIDGVSGLIRRTEGPVGFGGYGGLIDRDSVIWSARPLLRWDTSKPLTGPNGGNWIGYPSDVGGGQSYGLCIDSGGNVWNTSYPEGHIKKYAPNGTLLGTFPYGSSRAQGCAIDRNGHVWVAHSDSSSTVGHLKNDGTFIGNVVVGSVPSGVAIDAAGKVWVTNITSRNVSRINPNTGPIGMDGVTRVGAVDFTSDNLGGDVYNYSDMTGSTLSGASNTGTWTVVFDSQIANAEWGRISWNAQVCGDGALTVTAASSTDNTTFSAAQNVTRGQDLTVPNGRYLRISVLFRRATTGESPILYHLAVGTEGYAPPAQTNATPTVDAGPDQQTALLIPIKLKGAVCDDGLPNGATLAFTWSKVSGPGSVTFANANALATTATITTPGAYVLRLTATDTAATVSDEITINISGTNDPPIIASQPPTAGCSTRPYSYQVVANDPNFGDVLSYALPIAPAGMTINATTGAIQWTPTAAQLSSHNVKVTVTDLGNNTVEQTWTINVASGANTAAPTITSTAPLATAVGLPYTYQVTATDPDSCEMLTYSLDVAPAGMRINAATGSIEWTPSQAQTGNHNVTVRVRDFAGLFATQSFTINVAPPDNTPPMVAIASPAAGATLNTDVPVIGSVNDNFLRSWTLEYQVAGGSVWTPLATGTTPVNNATLGTFPATLLANNAYRLRLRASDFSNEIDTFREVIVNSGDLKLGAFTLAYEDLRLPFAGVPIVVRRFYDSRRAESGDFGPGWTLGFSNVDIRTDANLNVFITLPNGRRVAFAFAPERVGFFPVFANRYVAAAGVYDTLENLDCTGLFGGPGAWLCDGFAPYNPQNYRLRTKEGLVYTINATTGIRKIEDRNGRFIEITPNGVTSSTGRNVTFTRNAQGRITQITDPSNNTLKYDYDEQGRLVRFTDQLNLVTSYTYYGNGHYLQDLRTPGNCRPLKTEYGPDGRVTAKVDNAGNRTTYSYDQANRTETITNPLNQTNVYKYDARGNLIEVRDPLNTTTAYTYDANNNNLSVTFPSGRSIPQTFDSRGNILTRTESSQAGVNLTTSYTYNSFDYIDTVTEPLGDKIKFFYDARGNLLRREYRAANDNVGSADSFTYDTQGNQNTWTDGEGKVTQYTYNSFGEIVSRRDPTNVTTRYEYDSNGNPSAVIDGLGNRSEFVYNGFNLLAQTRHGGQTLSSVTYNELNKPITVTDALNRVTTFGYDCQGNLIQVTDPAGNITRYQVDALASLKKVTDARSNVTNYLYDVANRQTARIGPDNQAWGTGYTPDSYIRTVTTPNSATIQFQYDGMGRTTREIRPEKTIEYRYADCCRQSQVVESSGAVTRMTSYSYDSLGRVSSITDPQNRTLTYTYNGRRQRVSMLTPDGVMTNYSYDDAGRVSEIRAETNWVRFTYDGAGRRIRKLYSNGASDNYSYNTRGQLTSVIVRDGTNAVIASYAYTLDANGNRTGVTYHDGMASYTLDALDRLTSENVSSTSLGSLNKTYSYDAVGNRLDMGASFGTDNRLLSDAGGTYGYDNNGNLITRGTKTFGYDSQSRLTSFNNTGLVATYQHDYLGRRVAKTVNGVTREFLYDGAQFVAEYLNGSQVARYVFGLRVDEALMVTRNGQTYFYHADGLGSVVAITNNSGQVIQRYGYDVWGNLRLNNGSFAFSGAGLVNTLTFTGREFDEESGLYHYRARAYDSAIGRFIQKDPQQGPQLQPLAQNLYAYVLSNPANLIDPTGEAPLIEYLSVSTTKPESLARDAQLATIGFLAGFSASHLYFLGYFLSLNDLGSSLEARWDMAVKQTEIRMEQIAYTAGLSEAVPDPERDPCEAGLSVSAKTGIPSAFFNGASLKIAESSSHLKKLGQWVDGALFGSKLPDVGGISGPSIEIGYKYFPGGFKCGAKIGTDHLRRLQPR